MDPAFNSNLKISNAWTKSVLVQVTKGQGPLFLK